MSLAMNETLIFNYLVLTHFKKISLDNLKLYTLFNIDLQESKFHYLYKLILRY